MVANTLVANISAIRYTKVKEVDDLSHILRSGRKLGDIKVNVCKTFD